MTFPGKSAPYIRGQLAISVPDPGRHPAADRPAAQPAPPSAAEPNRLQLSLV